MPELKLTQPRSAKFRSAKFSSTKVACLSVLMFALTTQHARGQAANTAISLDSDAYSLYAAVGNNQQLIQLAEVGGTSSGASGDNNSNKAKTDTCEGPKAQEHRIDRIRRSTHTRLCNTVRWIDSRFGDDHEFNDKEFTALVSVGFRQDESDGFDPRVRVRIKAELPNVSSRFNAFVGRVDGESYISNTETEGNRVNNVGLRSNDVQDDEWLIGLGYRRAKEDRRGFDYSVGAKLNSGLSPYAQVAYRHNFIDGENHHWRSRQTIFWKRHEKLGFSSRLNYNYFINDNDIFDWTTDLKYTEELEQWEWITSGALHHSFSDKSGISSRVYARGEDNIEVSVPEFGVTFTYIRPVLRDWFIMEAGVDFRWEKEFNWQEAYQSKTRVGIQFEMLLGDYYRRYRSDK